MKSLVTVNDVVFRYEATDAPQVDSVSFVLHEGHTFGVLGGNECGKTTLAQLLLGNLLPEQGEVKVFGNDARPLRKLPNFHRYVRRSLVVMLLAAFLSCTLCPSASNAIFNAGGWALPLLLIVLEMLQMMRARRGAPSQAVATGRAPLDMLKRGVAYLSSEHDAGQKLPADQTIEEAIGADMPLPKAARAARRREVKAALEASGFRMYAESGTPVGNAEQYLTDGVKCGELSGGQKHLVYMLSVLAARPRVLICDECLSGLDIDRQSSMLQLLQKLQLRFGMAIIFMTVDLTSFSLMAQTASFMKLGRFIETGTAHDILEKPQRKDTLLYVSLSHENEARAHGKNLRNAFHTGQSVFHL